jgi:hypothetical protein
MVYEGLDLHEMYALLVIAEHMLLQFSDQNNHSANVYNFGLGGRTKYSWLCKSHGATVTDLTKRPGPIESKRGVGKGVRVGEMSGCSSCDGSESMSRLGCQSDKE